MERSGNMYVLEPHEAFNAQRSTREGSMEETVCQGGIVRVENIKPDAENSEIYLQWKARKYYIFGHETFEETVYTIADPHLPTPEFG